MIGLDTNVLVRFLAQDDELQAAKANRLFESLTSENAAFISTVTLVETTWVLSRLYRRSRPEIGRVVEDLLRTRVLIVEDVALHNLALAAYRVGAADYSDAFIAQAGQRAGCSETVTFDRGAARSAGMRLLT